MSGTDQTLIDDEDNPLIENTRCSENLLQIQFYSLGTCSSPNGRLTTFLALRFGSRFFFHLQESSIVSVAPTDSLGPCSSSNGRLITFLALRFGSRFFFHLQERSSVSMAPTDYSLGPCSSSNGRLTTFLALRFGSRSFFHLQERSSYQWRPLIILLDLVHRLTDVLQHS